MTRAKPVRFSTKLEDEICQRIATGESLRKICSSEGTPRLETVLRWVLDEDHEFDTERYMLARKCQAEVLFDEMIDIVDDGSNDWMERETKGGSKIVSIDHEHVARSRLRFDARRWMLARMDPKRFSEKVEIKQDTTVSGTVKSVPHLDVSKLDAGQRQLLRRLLKNGSDDAESGDTTKSGEGDSGGGAGGPRRGDKAS